jgi:peptide/nickel transport system substrate-binding protein
MKKTLAFILALMLVLSLGIAAPAMADKANDTLIYGIEGDPGNDINTISTSGRYDLMTERMLYSNLYNYYGPEDITYNLAESVEVSEDKMTYTVKLRDGVKWSDGEALTADDVVFTYDKIIEFDYADGHDAFVYDGKPVEITKVDDLTVQFKLPVMAAGFMESLSAEHYIMPKHIYEGDATLDKNPKNQTPVGTGPYTLEEYVAGQYVKFKANPNYFLGAPKIGTVIFQIVSDMSSAALALKKGEINMLVIPNASAADYEGTDVTINAYPEDRVGYMSFNMGSPLVADINLRKACMFALSREEMNVGAYLSKDFYTDAVSFLPYAAAFYTTDGVEAYAQNLDTAKEFMAKTQNVQTLRLAYTANNVQQETQAMVIQQNLKAIGVNVELMAMDVNALFDKLEKGTDEFEMFLSGYIMGVDPNNYASLFVTGSAVNYSKMSDPDLDELFRQGSIEVDAAKRAEIYKKAQQKLADDAVFFPIVTNSRLLAVTNDVDGVADARLVPIYTFEDMSKLFFK